MKWVFKFVYFWLTFWHLFFDRIWSNGSSGFIWFQCQIRTRSQFSQRRYLSFVQTSVERLVERICKGSRRSDTWQVHNAKNEVCQHFFRETDVLFFLWWYKTFFGFFRIFCASIIKSSTSFYQMNFFWGLFKNNIFFLQKFL